MSDRVTNMAAVGVPKNLKSQLEQNCPLDCECRKLCPVDCLCKKPTKTNTWKLILTAIGIMIAVFATYLIAITDSKLYLVFWICYSVLRRLMVRSKAKVKTG